VLVWFAVSSLGLIGFIGVTVDVGHMYVVRSEGQAFVDAAALAAAAELDGTTAGITRAGNAATTAWTKYHFGNTTFPSPDVGYGKTKDGPWSAAASVPSPPVDFRFVRVTTTIADLPMYLMPIVTGQPTGTVAARAVAGQINVNSSSEGLFPFSPAAHSSDQNSADGYGLIKGQSYTIRWDANADSEVTAYIKDPVKNANKIAGFCPGDKDPAFINGLGILADQGLLGKRGYIEINSTSVISQAIVNGYQSFTKTVGDLLDFSGGMKASTYNDLITRINSDPNQVNYGNLNNSPAVNWAAFNNPSTGYYTGPAGNGRRIVVTPIARPPDGANPNTILDFGAFLLEPPSGYSKSPQDPWCAMYIGSGVEWSTHPGASIAGLYILRLVQ
jgi:Flp pilus assembly protein TadG